MARCLHTLILRNEKVYPSNVRQLIGCGTNADGWAHCTEHMMLDEGSGFGDLEAAP